MPAPTAGRIVDQAILNLSRDPSADLAAAALQAREAAGLDRADFIVIAVAPGEGDDRVVEAALGAIRSTPARPVTAAP